MRSRLNGMRGVQGEGRQQDQGITSHHPTIRHEHMRRVHVTHGRALHLGHVCVCVWRSSFFLFFWFFLPQCQRLLTAGIEAWSGVLELSERFVDLERLGDVLCALRHE